MNEINSATERQAHSESPGQSRRSFLKRGSLLGALTSLPAAAIWSGGSRAQAAGRESVAPGDIAMLRFLAAAELVEADLWQQYCELAVDNPDFRRALMRIDESLPRYICDDRDDEASHASLINAFLGSIGETPVNLDAFRTLPNRAVPGLQQVGRLTNLTCLNVDTSWYLRYRSAGNPDFGSAFPQIVDIREQPTIPLRSRTSASEMKVIAQSAAFHFAAIEQGGSSLYLSLIPKASDAGVLTILASIGPTEVYHFATFQTALEGISRTPHGRIRFPDLRSDRELAEAVMPEPCLFLDERFPPCSVIRPGRTENSGALAAALGLVQSGLFIGQSDEFLEAVVGLATAADAAVRE